MAQVQSQVGERSVSHMVQPSPPKKHLFSSHTHSLAPLHHAAWPSTQFPPHVLSYLLLFSCTFLPSRGFTVCLLKSPPGLCSQGQPKQGKEKRCLYNFGTRIPLGEAQFSLPHSKEESRLPTPILVIIATTQCRLWHELDSEPDTWNASSLTFPTALWGGH